MNSSVPKPVTGLVGTGSRGQYGAGSKSERETVFLDTADARYLLRRKTGPAFGDPQLEAYVGRTIACDGFLLGTSLLAENIRIIG
jgi:hypothetical protein